MRRSLLTAAARKAAMILRLALAGCFCVIGCVLPAIAADPPLRTEIHYAPGENLERIDVALIAGATSSIDLAAYLITDRAIAAALATAGRRGVAIRIRQDGSEAAISGPADAMLASAPNVTLRFKPAGKALMHLKSYCVDGTVLRTGSANFSHSGETAQDNDLVILRGEAACAGFERAFEQAWGP